MDTYSNTIYDESLHLITDEHLDYFIKNNITLKGGDFDGLLPEQIKELVLLRRKVINMSKEEIINEFGNINIEDANYFYDIQYINGNACIVVQLPYFVSEIWDKKKYQNLLLNYCSYLNKNNIPHLVIFLTDDEFLSDYYSLNILNSIKYDYEVRTVKDFILIDLIDKKKIFDDIFIKIFKS